MANPVVVLAPTTPDDICLDESGIKPLLSAKEEAADSLDAFNKPRLRRAIILKALEAFPDKISFQTPPAQVEPLTQIYSDVHSKGLLEFLTTSWSSWVEIGDGRRNPGSTFPCSEGDIKPFIPINVPLPRDPYQRPSKNVMGQIGYYCTDTVTPMLETLLHELTWDSTIIQTAVEKAMDGTLVYAMPTHPGHHAAKDSFGGYCYLNQAAFAARLFQSKHKLGKIAVLDIGK
jgi:acetoin utilization deacetylase AcuC-like enzyme